ncbi:MAG: hypothetical protein H0T79_01560 [Deltaproteobacteria bacterium]|nr:hypothetical protein [Deltaproteobacteria bacterium]
MTKLIAAMLGTTLCIAPVFAQPSPPTPLPNKPDPTKTDEKAGSNESLSNGAGTERPWAKGVSEADQQTALAMFRDGNKDLNDGAYVIAADKYRKALKHWEHPAINYNLALALLNLDQPIEVLDNLQQAIKYGPAPLEKEKYEKANEYILLLEKQIAFIEVSCEKKGADVLVDGKKVFTAPGKYNARVRVGKHVFAAEPGAGMGAGYTAKVTAPFIDAGQKYRIELKMYTVAELTRYKRTWERTWAPWVVVGTGAAVVIAGGLLNLSAQSSYDDFDKKVAECNAGTGTDAGCDVDNGGLRALRDSGDSKQTAGLVMYGVGGVAIAAGLTLAWINRPQAYQIRGEDFENEQAGAGKISLTPVVTPGMAGAMVHGSF